MAGKNIPRRKTLRPLSIDEMATYWVRPPQGSHRQFSIFRRVTGPNLPKPESRKVPDDSTVKLVNEEYARDKSEKSYEYYLTTLKDHIRNTYQLAEKQRRGDAIACADNESVVIRYLEKKYPEGRRRRMDFRSVEAETRRTLSLLKTVSILTITPENLQACINRQDALQQKRYVHRMNSILEFLGRSDVELYYDNPERPPVRHILRRDLTKLVAAIRRETTNIAGIAPRDFADFVVTLFCTGARIGEALAMRYSERDLRNHFIRITQQLKQNRTLTATKNKKPRRSVVIDFGITAVSNWIRLDKSNFDRFEAAKYLSAATAELFKDDELKHISLHGLRHSYAIYLLGKEISISSVALFLGDSISTAEKYYIDFTATDENIENAVRKLGR